MMNKHPFQKLDDDQYLATRPFTKDEIVQYALYLISPSVRKNTDPLTSPGKVRKYLSLYLGREHNEKFWGLFLDNRHRALTHEILFHGTIDSAAVYPRVVVKRALECNAAAVIFAHNHPSGVAEPSDTDVRLTRRLTEALALVDIRVLDHLIIGDGNPVSLAERGLL